MRLNVLERIKILSLLPDEGNYLTLKIVNDLKMKLSFTEEEHKEFELKIENDSVTWGQKGFEEREIEIGDKASEIIKEVLEDLNKNKKLNTSLFSLYEKFVENTN